MKMRQAVTIDDGILLETFEHDEFTCGIRGHFLISRSVTCDIHPPRIPPKSFAAD